jgi:glycosyltransferase involved in cell wall biosynthesis
MTQLPMTLLVMTYNEAHSIGRCLDSVTFVSEKVVIDSGSTDDTVAIAQSHGARVVHQDWLGFGPQRNFATDQATQDWILFLDADEFLSTNMTEEMLQKLPKILASDAAGAILKRSAWFMGGPMRWYRPMAREKTSRLYNRRRARWRDVRVHESLEFNGRVETFNSVFYHDHNPTLVHKYLKVLLYSELKALDWVDNERGVRLWETPFVFLASFIKDYFFRLGMLDGGRGLVATFISAQYAVYKRLRYYELARVPESRELAAKKLAEHNLRL